MCYIYLANCGVSHFKIYVMLDISIDENLKILGLLPIHATRGVYSDNYYFELEKVLTTGILKLSKSITRSKPGKVVIRFNQESDIYIDDFEKSLLSTHLIHLVEKWSQIVVRPRLEFGYSFYHLNVFYFKKEDFYNIIELLQIIH
jgi:hypothetical protein